jgi:hypothetical protein
MKKDSLHTNARSSIRANSHVKTHFGGSSYWFSGRNQAFQAPKRGWQET